MQRSVRVTGITCGALALLSLAPAIPIRCFWHAARIASVSFACGTLLGLAMAGITRTRRPTLIYLLMLAGAATMLPLYYGWPYAFTWDILNYSGRVDMALTYLEALRPVTYLLGVPFTYAWCGQHRADELPERAERCDEEKVQDGG